MTEKLLESNLFKRIGTALALIPLTIALLLYAPVWGKQLAVFLIFLGLTYEWSSFAQGQLNFYGAGFLLSCQLLIFTTIKSSNIKLSTITAVFCLFLLLYHKKDKLFAVGQIYITSSMLVLITLIAETNTLLWMLTLIWLNDSFAYFSGRIMGGPKLCPTISPKKTWSGLIGGVLIGSTFGGLIASHLSIVPSPYIMSIILSFAGHGGDLLESAAKRYYNVKDSSQVLPGHGGLLDRLDSLLAILIVYYVIDIAKKILSI